MSPDGKRILSGMQPTGKLHLGNLVGALENWVELQNSGYNNFHMVADWHSLTTDYNSSGDLNEITTQVVLDWLSAGIDPEKSVIFVQSHIKEHAELNLLLSMLITVPRLERNPTLKERVRDTNSDDNLSFGHLGYPVLQAADILIYRANLVPVGEDQLPHIEITRELARKFNSTYGNVFPVPEGKLTEFSRLPGLDNKKMSKSVGNTILMSDDSAALTKKVMSMITDPEKIYKDSKGHPDICPVFAYHNIFNKDDVAQIRPDCEAGTLGCVDCKTNLAKKLNSYLDPLRERRAEYESKPDAIRDIIHEGDLKAKKEASETMSAVYEAMKFGHTSIS
ncbi:MAG: tryptophan--tRNA ligase [Candidatus Marinimicrobia bacterium]|nr:tryptophan--tRNA ligase [Candidatus Neomarinimicrobiota bacterium]